MQSGQVDTVVVGAGIAGLACASALQRRGVRVRVLDRARGVGGRCASWRSESGIVLDYGLTFLHGSEPSFLEQLSGLGEAGILADWPRRVRGRGTACQPRAFSVRERRVALRDGVSAWPKQLARGLDVRLNTEVVRLDSAGGVVRVHCADGSQHEAADVVLTLACEQALRLLGASEPLDAALAGPLHVLRMLGTVPCLTLLGTYPVEAADLDWDICYPEQSEVLKLISNESSKRPTAPVLGLVLQARAAWSRRALEQPEAEWTGAVLREAAALLGPWAGRPSWTRAHSWRYARTDLSSELAGPALVTLEAGARVGLAGELFARGAGLEAAWRSGNTMADRLADSTRA